MNPNQVQQRFEGEPSARNFLDGHSAVMLAATSLLHARFIIRKSTQFDCRNQSFHYSIKKKFCFRNNSDLVVDDHDLQGKKWHLQYQFNDIYS